MEDHNHIVDKVSALLQIYSSYVNCRIFISIYLSSEDYDEHKKEVRDLLSFKVNKKLLQQHMSESTRKIVTLRDISNMQSRKSCSRVERNNLETVRAKLLAIEGNLSHNLLVEQLL